MNLTTQDIKTLKYLVNIDIESLKDSMYDAMQNEDHDYFDLLMKDLVKLEALKDKLMELENEKQATNS